MGRQEVLAVPLKSMNFKPPVIQVALDYPTVEQALDMAKLAVEAGVDWLEAGTPLIYHQGLSAIGRIAQAYPDYPVLADYKSMDSGGKNVDRTHQQGGRLMTVCANAPDETVQAAVTAGRRSGIWVVADTIGVKDQAARARQCADWGVDIIYLHYGADQWRANNAADSTQWLDEVMAAVSIPVGVGCFGIADAVRAVQKGAEHVVIGHPLISSADPLADLKLFVKEVRANYRARPRR